MKNAKLANNIARVIAAAYIGALIAGPSPFGWAGLASEGDSKIAVWILLISVLTIPWLVCGVIAGWRLALYAVGLGLLFWQSSLQFIWIWGFLWIAIWLPIGAALLAMWLSHRLGIERLLGAWHHWRMAGILALLLGVYTSAIGPSIAHNAMHQRFQAIWPTDAEKIKAHGAGAFVAVDGITWCKGCGFPDTYYADPTGLVFLYKVNLD